jgi:lipid-binding SYLF domain-containing protein
MAMKRRGFLLGSSAALALAATGCSTSGSDPSAPGPQAEKTAKRREIDASVDSTLTRLANEARGSREMAQKARGILVFPSVLKVGFIVGGEYGEGALRSAGRTVDYYKATTGSLGLQAGAQSKAIVIMFMTQDAYQRFLSSSGWTAGADASVTLIEVGADASVNAAALSQPVVGYVLTNQGLMAGVSLEGTKVSKLDV